MEIARELDVPIEPKLQSHSPSSVSEVDSSGDNFHLSKRQKLHDHQYASTKCVVNSTASVEMKESTSSWDGRDDVVGLLSPRGDINEDVTCINPSSKSRKRSYSDVSDHNTDSSKQNEKGQGSAEVSDSGSESFSEPLARSSEFTADVDGNSVHHFDCSDAKDDSLKRYSRRTLYIEYWSRTDECKERKWDHLDDIADKYGSAEEHIFATTLNGTTACLEPNMFPYDTPSGIEHWTLWHVNELNHEQIKQYVENWIDVNAPHVEQWNYDDNPERSIDIFHVHVYLQVANDMTVLQGRDFRDLVHEFD